jgi:hypothetical protein
VKLDLSANSLVLLPENPSGELSLARPWRPFNDDKPARRQKVSNVIVSRVWKGTRKPSASNSDRVSLRILFLLNPAFFKEKVDKSH